MNTIHNNSKNDLKLLIYNPYSFYFIPITNSEIINVTNSMKSKVSMDVNNYDMSLIKILLITAQLHFYHKLVKYLKKLYMTYNRLSNFIIKHKIINKNQYGFILKYNTTISLLNIQHYIVQKNSEHK